MGIATFHKFLFLGNKKIQSMPDSFPAGQYANFTVVNVRTLPDEIHQSRESLEDILKALRDNDNKDAAIYVLMGIDNSFNYIEAQDYINSL